MENIQSKLLTPKEIVAELDKHIVGQHDAKRAVAIALRNRWRRKQIEKVMRDEIHPRNILMVGPTGVGKTEIARRLAKLVDAPFVKVEATKFTEVGYVGRDVDSIIRDLVENAIAMHKNKATITVAQAAKSAAFDKVISILVGDDASTETRALFVQKVQSGQIDDKQIEVTLIDNAAQANPMFDIPGVGQMGVFSVSDMFSKAMGSHIKTKTIRMTVKEALTALTREESEKMIDSEAITRKALEAVEQDGIVFIDEIDKICSREGTRADVSRQGVQRDLLPLIEGTIVNTKYGQVKTDHILFIASGAFHLAKPSDLLPELQGRLPIRVELNALTKEDFVRILKEPKANLIMQSKLLLEVEEVQLIIQDDAVQEIAEIATNINKEVENIGARRLHTILEKLLDDINYNADEFSHQEIIIDKDFVAQKMKDIIINNDLAKFIL